jgi:antitoxin VapB
MEAHLSWKPEFPVGFGDVLQNWAPALAYIHSVDTVQGSMARAKVFRSGNSQAVRLPKAFRLDVDEVEIFRQDGDLVLRPGPRDGGAVYDALRSLAPLGDDWQRDDQPPEQRESL